MSLEDNLIGFGINSLFSENKNLRFSCEVKPRSEPELCPNYRFCSLTFRTEECLKGYPILDCPRYKISKINGNLEEQYG